MNTNRAASTMTTNRITFVMTLKALDNNGIEYKSYVPTHMGGDHTGVHVRFENGARLSVQWHDSAYSNIGRGDRRSGEEATVEAAAWYPDGTWFHPFTNDDVMGYATIDDVLRLARAAAAL